MVLTALKKERKKAQEATPEQTDDERLISIRAFMGDAANLLI